MPAERSHQRLLASAAAALLALAASVALVGRAAGQHVDVEELVLDNGMTFLLLPRYEEPNQISAGWAAKVGSVDERPGITGISHFFEHMMFKGTRTIGTPDAKRDAEFMAAQKAVKDQINALVLTVQYERYRLGEIDDPWDPANDTDELGRLRDKLRDLIEAHREVITKNEFDQVYTAAGASGMNAFTTHDLTFYFITVPSNKLELWAWMESDRLSDSVFREFYAERDVVHEERRMRLESSPTGELDEAFEALFWQSSPYSWPVIGWPSDLNSYTREEFDEYFDVYYRPNNLVGVIVGDFQPQEAKALIERYFGRLERGTRAPRHVVTLEMEQIAEQRLVGECDCQPQVEVRYHTVPFRHRDSYALDLLAGILNGRTGRLYKSMIEGKEIASTAAAMQESRKHAGYFALRAEVKGDATPDDLELAWYEEIERLRTEPVPDLELQKVKNRVATDSYRRLQENTTLLEQLGIYEAMGAWEYINESGPAEMAVTAEEIQRVIATYFAPENRSVAVYRRRPGAPSADDGLASIPPEARQQVEFFLQMLRTKEDPDELRTMLSMMEAGAGNAPAEHKPIWDFMLNKARERIAELEKARGSDGPSDREEPAGTGGQP